MKNIHILPTDKPSRLYLGNNGNFVFGMMQPSIQSKNDDFTNQNIYITNDEEIKEGDWMIRGNEQPIKVTKDFFWDFGVRYYKIILTTDQDLIKDGVQAIDDEFLEWLVKNPSCEVVEVEDAEIIEKVADEFAIGFLNWYAMHGSWIEENLTSKELLEIYKKEKGL